MGFYGEASLAGVRVEDLPPLVRHVVEENEGMLFEISKLRHDVRAAREEIARLKGEITTKNGEVENMRERLGEAYTGARDAEGKAINYKAEYERVNADNIRLKDDYKRVCGELDKKTNNIHNATKDMRLDSARGSFALQYEQFQTEITTLLPNADKFLTQLKRCEILSSAAPQRMAEEVEKNIFLLDRLKASVKRVNSGEESRVNDIRDALVSKKGQVPPGDLAIILRWMIMQAFTAGIVVTEGNLKVIKTLIPASEGKQGEVNGERNGDKQPPNSGRRMLFKIK